MFSFSSNYRELIYFDIVSTKANQKKTARKPRKRRLKEHPEQQTSHGPQSSRFVGAVRLFALLKHFLLSAVKIINKLHVLAKHKNQWDVVAEIL